MTVAPDWSPNSSRIQVMESILETKATTMISPVMLRLTLPLLAEFAAAGLQ